MNRSLMWRAVLIIGVIALFAFAAYPPRETINLGLDLQGGMHLVLQVNTEDAIRSETNKDMERVRQEAVDAGIAAATVERTSDDSFKVSGVPPSRDSEIGEIVRNNFLRVQLTGASSWDWRRQGPDLLFEMSEANRGDVKEQSVVQALQTIRNRVDAFGVAEPLIARQGLSGDRLVVQLPGVDDPERVRELIKSTAFLEMRLVDVRQDVPADSREQMIAAYGGALPADVEVFPEDLFDESGRLLGQQFWALEKAQVITGRDLKDAQPGLGQFQEQVVEFGLTPEGGRRFGEITGASVGRFLAIILDGKVQGRPPVIQSQIFDRGMIQGRYTPQEAADQALILRSGALPASIDYLEERTVGPSLGRDSIDQGVQATLLGGLLVIFVMLIVYKLSGINAVLALVLNVVIVFGALSLLGATLTLPGIAGILLTIGMAVDANVLVFERIKEELRAGRTVKSAIAQGFRQAMSSVVDANVTTLMAALFLFNFGSGPIKGFAVTLSVGILASLFTAIIVSRFIFDLVLSRSRRVEKLSI